MDVELARIQRLEDGRFVVHHWEDGSPRHKRFVDPQARAKARRFVKVDLVERGLPKADAKSELAREASRESLRKRSAVPDRTAADLGRRLRLARESTGLSLRAAAGRSGLSPSGLSLLERGARTASHTSLLAVARTYNVAICIDPDGGTRIDPVDQNPGGTRT